MDIVLKEITIREVTNGYKNSDEEGVVGYGGKLNIRPKYQREYVYDNAQRNSVIETVKKNFPLNVMYWVKSGEDSYDVLDLINPKSKYTDVQYEVLDGQQRTISICEYVAGTFSLNNMYFHNLTDVEQNQILDYKLMVYFCEGDNKEKLDWFKTINIAGAKLTNQELRNAIYTGTWLTDAKKYFSKTGCPAYQKAKDYMNGYPNRQEYLETVIDWISKGNIEEYMAKNQHEPNASELWLYFNNVITWVKVLFTNYRKEMKGVDFGTLYNSYKDAKFDAKTLEKEISTLMQDEDVTKKSGIYEYVITRNEKYLSIRAFTDKQKREAFERQAGVCVKCNVTFELSEMEADHIKPWHQGGKTTTENCQMLCKHDNRIKSSK